MKVVINKCFGGFSLSQKGMEYMGLEWDGYGYSRDLSRNNPKLVKCVEELGDEANGDFARLEVVEIPDGTEYTIEEYDGREHIAEKHQTWG